MCMLQCLCPACIGSVAIFMIYWKLIKMVITQETLKVEKISADLKSSIFATFLDVQLIIILSLNFTL